MNDRGDFQGVYNLLYDGDENMGNGASLSTFPSFYFHPAFVFLPIIVLLLISYCYFSGFKRKKTPFNPTDVLN